MDPQKHELTHEHKSKNQNFFVRTEKCRAKQQTDKDIKNNKQRKNIYQELSNLILFNKETSTWFYAQKTSEFLN